MDATAAARRQELFARTPDHALIGSLRILEAVPRLGRDRTAEETMVRAWTLEEIERRWPVASDAVEAAFDAAADDEEVDYAAVLLAAIPAGVPGLPA